MVEAVVFDYGKVISLPPLDETVEEMAALAGVPAALFEKIRMAYRNDYDRGALRGRAYYQKVMKEAGALPQDPIASSAADALADRLTELDVHSWARINPETEALMREIRNTDRKLGILSNMPFEFLEKERDVFRVFDLCNPSIFSCHYKVIKPERAIYQILIDALGCAPEEIVFFDDLLINVEGARNVGITAYLWKCPDAAREILKTLGVLR
jgi:putative hydrolase of the HAD superfamily